MRSAEPRCLPDELRRLKREVTRRRECGSGNWARYRNGSIITDEMRLASAK